MPSSVIRILETLQMRVMMGRNFPLTGAYLNWMNQSLFAKLHHGRHGIDLADGTDVEVVLLCIITIL